MNKKKLTITLGIFVLLTGLFVLWRGQNTWTYDDYYECADAGHPTIEPSPPTCYHPNGSRITPGTQK